MIFALVVTSLALPGEQHETKESRDPFFITWHPQEFICPVDGEKNIFRVIGSYGNYVYNDRSQYQWVFFPRTSQQSHYMCKKCHLALYMWDFDKVPKEKVAELKKITAEIKVSKDFKDYQELKVVERLEAMEKIYAALEKDDTWWELFYRSKAFHYAKAEMADKALEARKKSLEYITRFLGSDKYKDERKAHYYISGAMKHYTGDDEGALADLEKALKTKASDSTGKAKAEDLENYEKNMNQRIQQYIEQIKSDKKPRSFDKLGNYHDHDTDM
jgi:tetratricopeptide (TPR) repeat protein